MANKLPMRIRISILNRSSNKTIFNLIRIKPFYAALKCLNFIHIYQSIKHWPKDRQLKAFVDFYHFLDPQGSAGWKLARTGIGGSEMSVLLDQNAYKDMRNLIAGKIKLPEGEFSGSIATRWGNLFEPITNLYMELFFNTRLYETGSIPGVLKRSDGTAIQKYSPDGIGLVNKNDYKNIIDQTSQRYFSTNDSNSKSFRELPEELILLFEFKNPYMRLPKGVVKEDYLAQPKTGMCTIPITDATLFVDSVIRKCSVSDFDLTAAYDTKFHCRKMRKVPYDKAVACGFVGIMDTNEPFERPTFKNNEWDVSDEEEPEQIDDVTYDAPTEQTDQSIIDAMAKQIASYSIKEIKQPKSDFYKTQFNLESLATVVRLVMNFFHNVADSDSFHDVDLTWDDEVQIVSFAVRRLFVYQNRSIKTEAERTHLQKDIAISYRMIPNILKQLNYQEPSYNVEDLDYGFDYGLTSFKTLDADDFELLVERLVDDRHVEGGLKMYYPDKFFFDVESENASRLMKPGNYIDYTTNKKKSAQKWLFNTVGEFIEFCRTKNVRPKGIIPWKLFEVCAMPMYKEPNFVRKHASKIRETVDIIDHCMTTDDIDERKRILDEYYSPPKPKRVPVPRAKKASPAASMPVLKSAFNQETADDFVDLDD